MPLGYPSPDVLGGVWFSPLPTMGIDRFRVPLAMRQGTETGNKSEGSVLDARCESRIRVPAKRAGCGETKPALTSWGGDESHPGRSNHTS